MYLTITVFHFVYLLLPTAGTAQNTISGKVWFDQNADGYIDNTEAVFNGIPVFLITCSGQFIQAEMTDPSGDYIFSNVPNGIYKIFFNTSGLTGYIFTISGNGEDNNAQQNGYTPCLVLNDENDVLNAGLTILSNVGNRIWDDLDGNGLQNAGEPGIAGMTVELIRFSDGVQMGQTVSDVNGNYLFDHIFPGQYYVRFLPSAAYITTINNISNFTTNSDITGSNGLNTTEVFTLTAGINNPDIDAGFYRCARICGQMYYDGNFSDTFNPSENGINGILVRLWKIIPNDTVLIEQMYTSSKPNYPSEDGYYEFCVEPGRYYLEVPINFSNDIVAGLPFIGINPNMYNHLNHANGVNTSHNIDVVSGSSFCNINNGFYCTGSVTSRVWFDENGNGILDGSDYGFANSEVFLYDQSYNIVTVGITDLNGYIVFDSLRNGSYFIHSNIPGDLFYTIPNMGDDDHDSDIDGTMGAGTSAIFVIDSCQHYNHIDAGIGFGILPLVWGDIDASKNKNYNTLYWEVINETNVSHYLVLKNKSEDKNWYDIGSMPSKGLNKRTTYFFDDQELVLSQDVSYKIKAVDHDGKVTFSNIVTIKQNEETQTFEFYPNPASDQVEIWNKGEWNTDQKLSVSMYNTLGVNMTSFPVDGVKKIILPVSEFPQGLYRLILRSSERILQTSNLVITR